MDAENRRRLRRGRRIRPPFKKKNRHAIRRNDFLGGGRWIRTTEVTDNRFTVCPLWPLGNSPIFTCALKRKLGAGRRTRTPDLLITNQLLYQLSYTSESSICSRIHSLISSAYITYHILHHLSTLFLNFFQIFSKNFLQVCKPAYLLDLYIL